MIQALPVGVLALQGAFREHARALKALGAEVVEVRKPEHLHGLVGLVLPGGESTTMGKLLFEWELMEPIKEHHSKGMALFGTCAGLILLCKDIEASDQPRLGLLDARVRRNAFGRQVDSFSCKLDVQGVTTGEGVVDEQGSMPAVFIRAPVITHVGSAVQVLASVPSHDAAQGAQAVVVRQGNVLAASFHPELTDDTRMHRYFLAML